MSSSYRAALAHSEVSSVEELIKTGLDITWATSEGIVYAAVLFSVVSCIVSFADLREHLSRLDYPKLQVLEMRIILMIPIYAIFSAVSLLFPNWRFFFVTIRDTYESFVLYMFFMLMIAYCGGEGQLLRSLKRKRYKGMHPFPMCWLPSYPLDTDFYLRCKRWVLQCALIKPVCSFVAMVSSPFGVYKEGNFALNNVYTYNCIIINFSLTWALYYLVLFEIECGKEMHYAKTFLKFLCIKSIIFFSYWQSIGVSMMASFGWLYMGSNEHEIEHTSTTIQDVLMCFELLPVSLMHRAAFGRSKLDEEMAAVPVYMKDNNSGNLRTNVDTALNVNDIIDDTIGTIFYRRGKLVDMENNEDSDSPSTVTAWHQEEHDADGNAEALVNDPTLEDLVRHAVTTDYGVRVDGVLHYDHDEDREERNHNMNYTDTDVLLRRSKMGSAGAEVRVDTDLLRSNQVQHGGGLQVYCVVCGRFDREMVRRRNGFKCRECVGTKSQELLRHRQRETQTGFEGGGGDGEDGRLGHSTADVVIEGLPSEAEDGLYVQALQADADLVGVSAPRDEVSTATVLTEGITNLNIILRGAFLPSSGNAAATPPPTCCVCRQSTHMVPLDGGRWRCAACSVDHHS